MNAADNYTVNGGTVTFAGNDTFGSAGGSTASPAILINSGGTLASGAWFNTIWNLSLNGGGLLSSGGGSSTYGTFGLAGTVTNAAGATSAISSGSGSYNLINLGNGTSASSTTFGVGSGGILNISTILQDHYYSSGGTQKVAGSLIKTGAGKLILSTNNTYTGGTTVNGGTLILTNISDCAVKSPITVNSGAILTVAGGTYMGFGASGTNIYINGGTVNAVVNEPFFNNCVVTMTGGTLGPAGNEWNLNGLTINTLASASTATNTGTLFIRNDYGNPNLIFNVAAGSASPDLQVNSYIKQIFAGARLIKNGPGKMVWTGGGNASGSATINAGTLSLGTSGTLGGFTAVVIAGSATFDVSAKSSTFTLGASQTLTNSSVGAVINGNNSTGSGTFSLVYDGTNACLIITNGTLTLSASTTIKVNNTGPTLPPGSYKIIARAMTGNAGLVAGTAPAAVTVTGAQANGTPSLAIVNGELYLNVVGGSTTITLTGTEFAYNGLGQSPSIIISGSTGARSTNYAGTGYSNANAPTNAGNYTLTVSVLADTNYSGATNSLAFTILLASTTITLTGMSFAHNGSGQSPSISISGSTGARSTNYTGIGYSSANAPTNGGNYTLTVSVLADTNYSGATNSLVFTIRSSGTIYVPITSYRLDISDDPENNYLGAPALNWNLFGGRMRIVNGNTFEAPFLRDMFTHDMIVDQGTLGDFNVPVDGGNIWNVGFVTGTQSGQGNVTSRPPIPGIMSSGCGKLIYAPGNGEAPFAYSLTQITNFTQAYTNMIYVGARVAEMDDIIWWGYAGFYNRNPVGPGNTIFPVAWQDELEADSMRGDAPYMSVQHNALWAFPYTAEDRITSVINAQIMARDGHVPIPEFAMLRSVSRQYPGPTSVQFSSVVGLSPTNWPAVLNSNAAPIWGQPGTNIYGKSYALARQMTYFAWLNGANYFCYEGGPVVRNAGSGGNPWSFVTTPLGQFDIAVDNLMDSFGPTGPVQTPIAMMSDFSRVWDNPTMYPWHKISFFSLNSLQPYVAGDYQRHGMMNFFYPCYLQTGPVYDYAGGEDYSMVPTPYGNSVDFMGSDAQPAALQRYGLIVWAGVPPAAPRMCRDKLQSYIAANGGRVLLFGAAAKAMFPEWFSSSTQTIGAGASVAYNGVNFTEPQSFTLNSLSSTAGMQVTGTVNGQPLIVETNGVVVVLCDYGLNFAQYSDPNNSTWTDGQVITNIPYQLQVFAQRVLDVEAKKQYLFDVGNTNLNYIVTRPGPGQYVLGLINDKMTSQPFTISSHIGTITNITEVTLNDQKDLLKSVVNGAAYAPAGLRNSPSLPLDYGLSDSSHIEGRDFRLFRVYVAESGVQPIAQFTFPPRPAGTVLAVPGLAYLRPYLQGIPSFFQWFDGVKVTARSVLDMDPIWLTEQERWLDRRGVRIVVDGRGLADADAVTVITNLALLKKAPKDLIIDSPDTVVTSAAAQNHVRLVASSAVNWCAALGNRFNPSATLNVMNLYYLNEQNVYLDYSYFNGGAAPASLAGYGDPSSLIGNLNVSGSVSQDYIYAGMYVSDLKALIQYNAAQFSKFKGIKIDSTYLLAKTPAALAADAAMLHTNYNLDVIVDLRRDQYNPQLITFYPHLTNYQKGMTMFSNIVAKMPVIGSTNLIVGVSDMFGNNTNMIQQRDQAWVSFANIASPYNVNLHLYTSTPNGLSQFGNLGLTNVYVIQGLSGGQASPYRLLEKDGSKQGSGTVLIHDEDRGYYCGSPWDIGTPLPADTNAPAAPTGLRATAGNGGVTLNWTNNSESDLASYTVWRATVSGGPYTIIASNAVARIYTDNLVINGATYYYVITAVDASNRQSVYSSQVSAALVTTNTPSFGSVMHSGSNIVIAGSGGTPGATFYVLSATNLIKPLTNWTFWNTNQFDAFGNFIITDSPVLSQRFYRLLLY